MNKFFQVCIIIIFYFSITQFIFGADSEKSYSDISAAFDIFKVNGEGESSFRSLLIPSGGRYEALCGSFSALSNDITFFDANPAGSSFLKNTELIFLHNNWIADSKLETLSYTQRKKNLGWGSSLKCFYIPFTEYDSYGEKKSSGFYSETFFTINLSYNFLAGYKFKGVAVGANLKFGGAAFPPVSAYAEKRAKLKNTFAVLGDFGIIIRTNAAKHFYDEEPNLYFGASFKNFGTPINGDVPPAYISLGFAYKPVSIFLFSVELNQNINFLNIKNSGIPYGRLGMMLSITEYFNLITGFGVMGANPKFTVGGEVNLKNVQLSVNYTLDLTNQIANLNKISLGAKILLGDDNRKSDYNRIKSLYLQGLENYKNKNYDEAIFIWKQVLELNKFFEPASQGVKAAEEQKKFQADLNNVLF